MKFHTKHLSEKPLCITFDKIDRFIKIFDGIRYFKIFGRQLYDKIYNRIRYLISEKGGITGSVNHNFSKIRVNPYNSLPIEKILTFHVIILTKSVVNKNKKGSYKDKSNTEYF